MSVEALIAAYGYPAILVGTFLEGEVILVLGGFAAHRGYLDLPWVIAAAFAGTLIGDQLYFHLGRLRGRAFLDMRPGWQAPAERAFELLGKHEVLLILGFRFMYGMRIVTPFVLGASQVPVGKFLVLNAISALLWAAIIASLGYLFGQSVEALLGDVERYELWIFAGLAAAGGIIWGIRRFRHR
ncbi:MAG: DedA family protein [Gammaproteobacteria bacterium]